MLDRHACYELCVQSPRHVVAMLRGVHAGQPITLREDFCGSASVSVRWLAEAKARGETARAVAVDVDEEALARARTLAGQEGVALQVVRADCVHDRTPGGADVIFVGNFSIGYMHQRSELVAYLRMCRNRLQQGNAGFGGGVFACDLYGGANAFKLGALERRHPARGREMIHYVWRHETADARTSMVRNSISFRVVVDGEVVSEMPRAFVYEWRLWGLAELRDALLEAGFEEVEVYKDLNIAPGEAPRPVADAAEMGEDWIVLVVAR